MKIVSPAALCGALMLSSCRHHAPVTRHFLRVPAEYAGGLSSIQRAQGLKTTRPDLPDRKTLTATGHLVLPEISTLRGTVLRGMEVLYVNGSTGVSGLAVITKPGDNLNALPHLELLTCNHATYTRAAPRTGISIGPVTWRIDSARRAITGYARGGGPVTVVQWSGSAWSVRSLP